MQDRNFEADGFALSVFSLSEFEPAIVR
jgi:hypothetical protein